MLRKIKEHRLEILVHSLFWGILFFAVVWLTSLMHYDNVTVNGKEQFVTTTEFLPALSFAVNVFLLLLFYLNFAFLYFVSFIKKIAHKLFVSFLIAGLFFVLDYLFAEYILDYLSCEAHYWDYLQRKVWLLFAFVWAASLTYYFFKEWYQNEMLRKQMEADQLATELNFLKSQINPHFLFNTLNNLFSMAQEKQNDELANGISKLSGMMRYMIYESNVSKVPLEKEIEYLKSVIGLNKLRYTDNEANVHFRYPENCKGFLVAPMLFIPFVENAFKYGVLINESSGIKINIEISELEILFTCENMDYSFVTKMKDSIKGIGLENVKRRLELLYPNRHSIEIENGNKKYSVVLKLSGK